MDKQELLNLIKKVEQGEATLEEKTLVLKILNEASEEYITLLKQRIEQLKNRKVRT